MRVLGTEQFVWKYYSGSEKMCKKKVSVSESVGILIGTFSPFGMIGFTAFGGVLMWGLSDPDDLGGCFVIVEFGEVVSAACEFEEECFVGLCFQ